MPFRRTERCFLAEIEFWGRNKNGRFNPPVSGYRPQILVDGVKTSCLVKPVDGDVTVFEFDTVYKVCIELMFPDEYGRDLMPGSSVFLFEGNRKVAEGVVLLE